MVGRRVAGVQQVGSCSQHGDTWLQHINTLTHQHISTQDTLTNSIYTFYTDYEYYDGLGLIGRTKHFFIFDDFDTNPKK